MPSSKAAMFEGAVDFCSCLSSASQTSCMPDPPHLHSTSEQAITGDVESDREVTHRAQKRRLPRVARWRGKIQCQEEENRETEIAGGSRYCVLCLMLERTGKGGYGLRPGTAKPSFPTPSETLTLPRVLVDITSIPYLGPDRPIDRMGRPRQEG